MAKTLVLGANGFIGSHLVDALADDRHDVRAFSRFRSSNPVFNESDRVEIFPGDYLNQSDLEEALKDIDYVFHFISTTTPATAENDPMIDIETNVRMSVRLMELCVDAGVKKIIFASTGGSIYGATETNEPYKETDIPLPISPYAIGKLTIEHYLRYFRVKYDLDSVILRISNPYGERQPFHRKQGVIPIFLENIYQGKPITVLGDGSMVRDYVYVKDVARMIVGTFQKQSKYDTYNIGSGQGVDLNTVVSVAKKVADKKVEIETKPAPSTFLHKVVLDTSRFTDEFGILPSTPLEEGMAMTYKYITEELKVKHET